MKRGSRYTQIHRLALKSVCGCRKEVGRVNREARVGCLVVTQRCVRSGDPRVSNRRKLSLGVGMERQGFWDMLNVCKHEDVTRASSLSYVTLSLYDCVVCT